MPVVLAVSDLDVGWGGGHSTGTLGLDLRQHPPRSQAQLETRGVRVEALFPASDEKQRITGVLRGRGVLKATGDDVEALRASLSGTVSATLSDGTIPSLLDAQMGLQVGKLMRSFISGNEALPLPCAAVKAELAGGQARISSLVIDSANTRTTGSGVVDLRDGSIDLKLTPEPKRPGLLELQQVDPPLGPAAEAGEGAGRSPRAAEGHRLRRRQALSAPLSVASACSCRTGFRSGRPRPRRCGCARRAPG